MDVKQKIEEYYKLKKQRDMIIERLGDLSYDIKHELISAPEYRENRELAVGSIKASVQIRKSKPKSDETLLETLLWKKGLYKECSKEVIDHDAVESAYLTGKLTDDDLRTIGAEPKITLALIVEEVEEDL